METKPKNLTKKPEIIRDKQGKFVKGISGNPEGRPEGVGQPFSLKVILERELQKCPEGQDKKTYADLIIKRMLKEAIEKGDIQQIKLIWNYIEGMPKQPLDIEGNVEIKQIEELRKMLETYINDGKLATKMPAASETSETK